MRFCVESIRQLRSVIRKTVCTEWSCTEWFTHASSGCGTSGVACSCHGCNSIMLGLHPEVVKQMKSETGSAAGCRLPAALQLSLLLLLLCGCGQESPRPVAPVATATTSAAHDNPQLTQQIQSFCGSCHAMPLPSSFPRDDWYREVRRGFDFYYESGKTHPDVPVQADVVRWFQEQAPEALAITTPPSDSGPVSFQLNRIVSPEWLQREASVSFVGPVSENDAGRGLFISLMKSGAVGRTSAAGTDVRQLTDAAVNPAAVRVVDLNNNGQDDLILADLGSPMPADHDRGRILWIPDHESSARVISLLEGIGRAADVRAADFDSDGDLDLIAAEFGWHATGGLHLIRNDGLEQSTPQWSHERLDARSGPIHVPTADLNGDGRVDFISLISQEHEVIEAWLNLPGGFEKHVLYAAPDPSWGSSGIELCDIDSDNDLDIIYTNGDTFDSNLMKPYHGIWLLRNQGNLEFQAEQLQKAPGVHRALPADVDQDGRIDIIACAVLPVAALPQKEQPQPASLMWLRQTESGSFQPFRISDTTPAYAAIYTGDVDSDGDPDIIAGCFEEAESKSNEVLHIFMNQLAR